MVDVNSFFVNELNNAYFTREMFLKQFVEWLSLRPTRPLLQLLFEHGDVLNICISRRCVATCLWRGRIFKQVFIALILLSLIVKKSFESRLTFGEVTDESTAVFDSHCTQWAKKWGHRLMTIGPTSVKS